MSVSDKEISSVGVSGVVGVSGSSGDDHDDDDDDDKEKKSGGVHQDIDDHNSFSGFSRKLGKAKKFVLRPFNRKPSRKLGSHIKAASSSSSSCFSGKRNGDDVNKSCCLCFTTTPSGESGIGSRSQSSDPNHPAFTHDMVRVLMEKSDFYSKECNTHLDSDFSFAED